MEDQKERDLVCGKILDEVRQTSVYQGKTYSFCSNVCKKEFETNPKRYVKQEC